MGFYVVSIPYGSLKTTASKKPPFGSVVMFQFLIGSLKTAMGQGLRIHARKFQFLIGSLKTAALKISLTCLRGFNSL